MRLLGNDGYVFAEMGDVHCAGVDFCHLDGAGGGFVEALDELGNRGLPDERNGFTRSDRERKTFEDRNVGAGGVGKSNIVEVDRKRCGVEFGV